MKMSELPRHIYRCQDTQDIQKATPGMRRKGKGINYTAMLADLPLGHSATIPKTSAGLVRRVAARNGHVYQNEHDHDNGTIKVTRMK